MSFKQVKPQNPGPETNKRSLLVDVWLPRISWGIAALMVAFGILLLLQLTDTSALAAPTVDKFVPAESENTAPLPEFSSAVSVQALSRISSLNTTISNTKFGF